MMDPAPNEPVPEQADEYDSPWKQVIERFFPAFMELFFPKIHKEIDWSRGYEFLDTELQKVVRDAALGKRYADKLVKVWRRDGVEAWVYIHVEVQGQRESGFGGRMYDYNHRIADGCGRFVVSLAVLADGNPRWRPHSYEADLWECKVSFEFPVVKLLDWRDRMEELEQDPSPFAIVVLAHLENLATRRAPRRRMRAKWRIARKLYERGMSREDIIALFHFIDWIMALPEPLQREFDDTVEAYEKEQRMEYVSHIERRAERRGFERGVEQGRGALRRQLLRFLDYRFGKVPEDVDAALQPLGEQQLEQLMDQALAADSLETFRRGLPQPKGS